MSYLSRVDYTGNGATETYSVTFPFISRTHVIVSLDLVEQAEGDAFTWLSDSQIEFVTAPAADAALAIYRQTPRDEKLVDFTSGAILTEGELDLNATQQIYLVQEMFDAFTTTFLNSEGADIIIDQILTSVLENAITGSLQTLVNEVQALKDELAIILASDFTLDFASLPELTTPDITADFLAILDVSAGLYKKIRVENISGSALGDGSWYKFSEQALTGATEATVAFTATDYNSLELGTYSTSTSVYTMGATGGRVQVTAQATVKALNAAATFQLKIRKNSTDQARAVHRNDADATAEEMTLTVTKNINLAAGDTVDIRAITSSAEDLDDGLAITFLSIVELG